jgi:chromosome segregation protein
MRIRRLDICGFKSFMDRGTFVFDEGITGVVGPNGCGKSNVVDAIRWVMGEQSAKHLRGRSMEDVIFNGSESNAPLSMAEVSLTFINDGSAALPPQYAGFPEITVTRRLFRSGDSEYLINKAVCRLLDITELFLGTGVGTKAYSIIEQGRIGLIVSSKPEDRKAMIEEAAGVTRYKLRKRAAERKMEYTEQNLLRVGDILGELEKRLEQLQRQARKAEKYKLLKAEMREIELHLASLKHLEFTAYARATREQLDALVAEEGQLTGSLREGEEQLTRQREALLADEKALATKTEQLFGLENQIKVDETNLEFFAREESETQNRIAQARTEGEALRAQLTALAAEREGAEKELAQLAELVQGDERVLAEREEELRKVSFAQSDAAKTLEEERSALVSAVAHLAQHQNNLANLARQRTDLTSRLARLTAEADTLTAESHLIEAQRQDLSAQLGTTRQLKSTLDERRGAEEGALAQTRARFAENEAKLIALREELSEKRSRLNSLVEIARNYEGYDRGVRAVMLRAGDDLQKEGIEGLVADLLSAATPEHEKALEAVLGQRLQTVVVHGREHGAAAIEFLKSAGEGRSSFIPLDVGATTSGNPTSTPNPSESGAPLSFDGLIGRALDVVRYQSRHANVVRALLGSVVLVRDLPAALTGSAQHPGTLTFVTPTGEVVDAQGVITGGTLEGPGAGALQRRREIQELADQVRSTETGFIASQSEHQQLSQKANEIESALRGLTAEGHEKALHLVNQEKDLARAAEELARVRERLGVLDQERESLLRHEAGLVAEESSSQGLVVAGEAEQKSREARVGELSGELERLKAQSEQVAEALTQLKIKLAGDAERREGVSRTLLRLAQTHSEQVEREVRLTQLVSENESRLADLASRRQQAQVEREQLVAEAETLRNQVTAQRADYTSRQQALTERDLQLKAQRKRLEEVSSAKTELGLRERELSLQLSHLEEQIRERYQLELSSELHRFHVLPRPGAEKEERVVELRAQVERMGEINLTAIDEYAELSKRSEFLTHQKADLEDSLKQLRSAILKIDQTSRERFKETFELVNEKFQQLFPRLFAGGKASLQMVEDPVSHEQGVEILAQPPGKSLKTVNLLSGGEKALTAVAMIFAIFLIKPTPFCLLDEVDAPLDDANVGRYNEMIREMSNQSQFILITHNKRTMEIVDTLYGVTMEEPGISKLVSVKLSEQTRVQGAA